MSGEKRFRTSFTGFNKRDVSNYIEKIINHFDMAIKEKDGTIRELERECKLLREKFEELTNKAKQIDNDRNRIADVLHKAQEKAQTILDEAKQKAIEDKTAIERQIEGEREKLVDIKQELRLLKSEVVNTLKKYEGQLNEMTGDI